MAYKVLHLIGGGEIGGAELHILHLFRHFNHEHIKPFLGCLSKNAPFSQRAIKEGFSAQNFPMMFPLDLAPIRKIAKFCHNNEIDLIHTHGTRANLVGRLAAKRLRIPSVTTIHSDTLADYSSERTGQFAMFIDDLTISHAAGMIAISRSLYENARSRFPKTLPFATIYNGVPTLDFSDAARLRRHYRGLWHIPDDALVLGTIGRLHPVKGQSYLIEAALPLQNSGKKIHLLIIGEGPLHKNLQNELEQSGLPYTLPGYQDNAWQILPAMDLFALPSLQEGMGLVLLEAAQAKIPIVAANTGGIPELFPNQEALLFPPGDSLSLAAACSSLLDDLTLRQRQIQKAYERAGQFTLEKMSAATTRFYERILPRQ